MRGAAGAPVRTNAARMHRLVVTVALTVSLASVAEATSTLIGLTIDDPITRDVVERYTLTRNLQPVRFLGTVRTTDWLLDRPRLAAALARHLHPPLEQYHIAMREDGTFAVNDLGSLRGDFRLVARGANRRIYFCQGQFRSLAYILPITGSMVFTLEYRDFQREADPSVEVTPQLYVRLDNILAHGVLRVIAPLLHGVIDRRVANLTAATQVVGERISRDPRGLYREMQTWSDIRPEDLEAYRQTFVVERFGK
jgi:hypothetical protein